MPLPVIAVTSGEPAGIGPDICLALAARRLRCRPVILADRELLAARAEQLGMNLRLCAFDPVRAPAAGDLEVLHLPLAAPVLAGRLNPANSRYVLALLERAVAACVDGTFAAMVTAPVHKGVINDAGVAFTGHTEYLAALTSTPRVVMMLAGGGLRVALATTHLALAEVAGAITRDSLQTTLQILHRTLQQRFGLAEPRILVAGLNPHSGEGGYLGREEIEVISPLLETLRRSGMRLEGPLPADTLFTPQVLARGDCVLAMYHDQGLPVLKYASFGKGVNVTLGLPIVRTSVDHGTALDLAGGGGADPGSLIAALQMALALGGPVTVSEPRPRRLRKLWSSLGGDWARLRLLPRRLPYRDYLAEMARHRLVLQADKSAVPGQVAGDALLCRLPCVGGDGAIDRLGFPSTSGFGRSLGELAELAARLLRDDDFYAATIAESQAAAKERVSFSVVARALEKFFARS